jgi:peptide/nickel transport system substrate-binding protein
MRVHLDVIPLASIQTQAIRPREYDALLFGEVLGANPDPFSFWHSSQADDPGLNLSLYASPRVDALLEAARQTIQGEAREEALEDAASTLTQDLPAIFLYNTHYLYILPRKIKGVVLEELATPSQRFEHVGEWYIDTARVIRK